MTKRYLAEQVLLRVNGGTLAADSNVALADVLAYLPYAHGEAVRRALFEQRNDDRREGQQAFYSGGAADPGMMDTFTVTPVEDSTRELYYADLPQKLLSLPNLWQIGNVYPQANVGKQYIKTKLPIHISDSRLGMIADYVWPELNGDVTRLWFSNMHLPVCPFVVQAVPSLEGYDDDDTVPVPAGLEAQIVEIAAAFFLNQRSAPADNIPDNNDANDTRQ